MRLATAAVVLGLVLAVFFVFRTLFTDGPANALHPEYLVAHAITVAAYASVVGVLAWRVAAPLWWWPAWVAGPGLVVVAAYNDPSAGVRLATGAAVLLGAAIGQVIGRDTRRKGRGQRTIVDHGQP